MAFELILLGKMQAYFDDASFFYCSISADHRNRGSSDIDRQQRDDSVKHIQSLSRSERNHRGGNMSYASSKGHGDSPADSSKFVSSGDSTFSGPSGSSGSGSGHSSGGGGSGKQSIGATYPEKNSGIKILSSFSGIKRLGEGL